MVIAPPFHPGIGTTARPPEALRPVLVEPRFVAPELPFKLALEIVRFVRETPTPAQFFLRRGPGHKLEFAFMLASVFTFPVAIVPDETEFRSTGTLVRFPVCLLAISACNVNCWKIDDLCCEAQLLTTIVPVLTACAALNCLFCSFSFVADGAFAYGSHVTGGYRQESR